MAEKRTEGSAPKTESKLGLVPPARTGDREASTGKPTAKTQGRDSSARPSAARQRLTAPRPRFRLTRRATILVLAVCAVVVTIAYPLQEYLAQRSQLNTVNQQNAQLNKQVSELQQQIGLWSDPGYVSIQARSQLHYVKPGEEGFSIPGPANGNEPLGIPSPSASPWFDKLWGTVKSPGTGGGGSGG